jgi:hypothetical protein
MTADEQPHSCYQRSVSRGIVLRLPMVHWETLTVIESSENW